MVTIYNTTLSATSQRHFSDSLGGVFCWLFQDAFGKYNHDSIAACILRYYTNIPFRITVQFRSLQYMQKREGLLRFISKLFLLRYRIRTAKMGCYLEPETEIAKGVQFPHGFPLVINPGARIGRNCIIHPNVLIGSSRTKEGFPTIGDNCFLGNGAKIIGNCKIGDWCFISPGALVSKDIPDGSVVGFGINNILSNRGKEIVKKYMV